MFNQNYLLSLNLGWHLLILLFGLCLSLILWTMPIAGAIPNFCFLILVHWSIAHKNHTFYTYALLVGVVYDIYTGQILGVTSLFYVLSLFVLSRMRQQLNNYPVMRQAITVGLIILGIKVVQFIIFGMVNPDHAISYWLEPLVVVILWPVLVFIMNLVRFRLN